MSATFDTRQIIVLAFAGRPAGDHVTCAIGLLRWRERVGAQAKAEH
jgi:hypothetical protein